MVKLSLASRCRIGLDFYEFLNETHRTSITKRTDLSDIYNNEFRARNDTGTRDPSFGSILYALKIFNKIKIKRRGTTISFTYTVRALYQDQWPSSRERQPEPTWNGAASPAEEAVTGVRARRKLASLLMNRLKTDRDLFISDKHGVSIKSDRQFEDGKLCLFVDTDEYVHLTVENTGAEPVYFTYYTPLHWLRYFSLTDEHKVSKTNPLKLNPGDDYTIQIRFHCSLVGFYPATLAFEFQPDLQSSTAFHIVRFIEAQCMPPFFSACPPHTQHSGNDVCQRCMLFYNTFVDIANYKHTALERRTVTQSASRLWHDARKVRITASTAKKVPIRGNPENYIREHLYPSFHGNEATRHGIESEALAYQWLQEQGIAVRRRGTVLCESDPWLSASPDGVLNSNELLEIKCPLLKGNTSLDDLFRSQRYDVKMVDERPKLLPHGPRGIYMQVQLGMLCTGLRTCRLLIWTPSEKVWLSIPYDEEFCATTVTRLKAFYFKYMLPRVSDEFQADNLLLSTEYLQFCRE